jgi:integrase
LRKSNQGPPLADKSLSATTPGPFHPHRPLHRDQGGGYRQRVTLPRGRTIIRRSGARDFLSPRRRRAPFQKAAAASSDSAAALGPSASMARQGHRKGTLVEWNGKPISSVKTALKTAVRLAKLPGKVIPHTLRHTAATWLMQGGVSMWRAAGFLGMSVETLDRVYGHHHPDYLSDAADAIGRKPNQNQALVVSLAGAAARREKFK